MESNDICDSERLIATAIAAVPGKVIAAELGIDETAVSRIRSGQRGVMFGEIPKLLALAHLHVVPSDGLLISAEELSALRALALKYLTAQQAHEARIRELLRNQGGRDE